jgi:hypothetical protein
MAPKIVKQQMVLEKVRSNTLFDRKGNNNKKNINEKVKGPYCHKNKYQEY